MVLTDKILLTCIRSAKMAIFFPDCRYNPNARIPPLVVWPAIHGFYIGWYLAILLFTTRFHSFLLPPSFFLCTGGIYDLQLIVFEHRKRLWHSIPWDVEEIPLLDGFLPQRNPLRTERGNRRIKNMGSFFLSCTIVVIWQTIYDVKRQTCAGVVALARTKILVEQMLPKLFRLVADPFFTPD